MEGISPDGSTLHTTREFLCVTFLLVPLLWILVRDPSAKSLMSGVLS